MAGESSALFAKQMSYNLPIPSLAELHAAGGEGYEQKRIRATEIGHKFQAPVTFVGGFGSPEMEQLPRQLGRAARFGSAALPGP